MASVHLTELKLLIRTTRILSVNVCVHVDTVSKAGCW